MKGVTCLSKDDTTGSIPTPSIKFTGTHLCTWVQTVTSRAKCLAPKHSTS